MKFEIEMMGGGNVCVLGVCIYGDIALSFSVRNMNSKEREKLAFD